MKTVRDMQRFMDRGECHSNVMMTCFQMLNKQRKRTASAVQLLEL